MLFVIAYFLYFKEAYWLISGVNTSPRQTAHERYNLPGLTKHLGRMCGLLGFIVLVSAVGAFAGLEMLFMLPLCLVFVIVPVFLFGTERYMYEGKKSQRIINIVITAFMAAVVIFVAVTTVVGAKVPVIEIKDEKLMIESMYGAEIPLESIKQVQMIDLTGRKIGKLNGFNMGNNLKGRFAVEDLGSVKLYQQGKPCISVLITTSDDTYIINLGSEAENESLKTKITDAVNKVKDSGTPE
jgi:hypothetical protein